MALKGSGGSELAQLMTDHILGYIYRYMLSAVMDSDRMTYKLRKDGGCTRPALENSLLAGFVHRLNSCKKLGINKRSLFNTSTPSSFLLPDYFAFRRFTMNLSDLFFLLLVL